MIVNLRGCGGSGKSYVGHQLLERYEVVRECTVPVGHPLNGNKTKPKLVGYELEGDLIVLGKYRSTCGGIEGWSGEQMRELVRLAARNWSHVYFEAFYVSMSARPWIAVAEELVAESARALPFVALGLNTPFDVCIERIKSRNGGKPINEPAQYQYWDTFRRRVFPLLEESDAITTRWCDYTRSVDTVVDWLRAGGWTPAIQ